MIDVSYLADGTVLLDARRALTYDTVREAQRALAEYRVNGFETIHIAGEHQSDTLVDELDSLGRVNVRLNIHRLIVVGESAHGMHRAAEHEGSWDGESIPVSDATHAYDEVVAHRGAKVAILVTGDVNNRLDTLVEELKGEVA